MEELLVNYDRGRCQLDLDKFFPVQQKRLSGMVRLIFRIGREGQDYYITRCIGYLDIRIPDQEKEVELAKMLLSDRNKELTEQKTRVEIMRKTPHTKEELKREVEKLKDIRERTTKQRRETKQAERDLEQLIANRNYLKSFMEG